MSRRPRTFGEWLGDKAIDTVETLALTALVFAGAAAVVGAYKLSVYAVDSLNDWFKHQGGDVVPQVISHAQQLAPVIGHVATQLTHL